MQFLKKTEFAKKEKCNVFMDDGLSIDGTL